MILPKIRDPRFITVRRGGTLQDDDHRLLAMWAADCAEHVLHHFERARPKDDRPRRAIDLGRAWARGEITWAEARTAAGHANAAARDLRGAARHAAYAAGQAAAVGHVAAHELGAAAYAIRAARAAAPEDEARRPAAGSASGSAPNSPTRSGSSCSTTSGCATRCAGSRSTAAWRGPDRSSRTPPCRSAGECHLRDPARGLRGEALGARQVVREKLRGHDRDDRGQPLGHA